MGLDNCFYCKDDRDKNYNAIYVDPNSISPNINKNSTANLKNINTSSQESNLKILYNEKLLTFNNNNNENLKKSISLRIDKSNFIIMKTKSLFDEYEIKEKLGEGAYGCVYKVTQKSTNFLRAVKAIERKHIDSNSFSNEIAILKTVDHPNIIKLFDCYYDNNFYYMVEEYCSGGDLFDYIQKIKNFSEKIAATIFNQLLSAINHLHKKNIVHRDIKPENIVFIPLEENKNNNDIFIKLIDFGTSVSIKNKSNLHEELGTIYYIAPEVFKNNYNEKADIWSCGIILYTMLCGHPPFLGNDEDSIKNKILNCKVEYPQNEFKNISKGAIDFLELLLENDPNKRISAEEALKNEWLINMLNSDDDNILNKTIIENLIKFSSTVSLQKATLSFLTNQISMNEEIKTLKKEFDKIDVNKDGEISLDELILCLKTLYPLEEAKKRAKDIFKEIDFNNDGSINFSEFLTVNLQKEKILNEDMLRKAFNLFDIDGNGYITIDELKQTLNLHLNNQIDWKDLVGEVDKDGDYQINFEEFKEMMEKLNDIKI
jgi:calcium-dependent protein kinase